MTVGGRFISPYEALSHQGELLDRAIELLRWLSVDEGKSGIPIRADAARTAAAFIRLVERESGRTTQGEDV